LKLVFKKSAGERIGIFWKGCNSSNAFFKASALTECGESAALVPKKAKALLLERLAKSSKADQDLQYPTALLPDFSCATRVPFQVLLSVQFVP
jgi:hypothetical protein